MTRPLSRHVSRGGKKWLTESRFATINVRGGMECKIGEVCQMMNERSIDVLCVNETKRKGCGTSIHGPYTAYWSGVPSSNRGCKGVGLLLSNRMAECVNEYEYVSPRLLWLRMKVGLVRIFLLGVYAPTDVGSNMSTNALKERQEF
jgi:exonuclease III